MLSFKINLDRKPITKRGLLSMISSVYNPLGYAAPFVLEGRRILQRLCNKNVQWNEIVQQDVQSDWAKLVEQLIKWTIFQFLGAFNWQTLVK